jgi:hypothetical protein
MTDYNGFGSLDLSNVEGGGGDQRKTIPPGNHIVSITDASIKDSAKGGKFILVIFENDAGQYVQERLNIVHKTSPQAVEIGMRKLKELLVCGGHPTPDKPSDIKSLLGLKLGVRVQAGQDWRDNEGNIRPGGGELRPTSPFFKPDDGKVSIGDAPKDDQVFGKADSNEDDLPKEDLDDSIPF